MDAYTPLDKQFVGKFESLQVKSGPECKDSGHYKSPVATVRELAKCNELQPVFETVKEEGPQHDKTFNVTLSLGSETWHGTGKSLKKAQIDASGKALKEYNFPKLLKTGRKEKIANPSSLTPTVLLNGLAMARGEAVEYKVISKVPLPCKPVYVNPSRYLSEFGQMTGWNISQTFSGPFYNNHYQNGCNKPVQRWIYPHLFRVEVRVGDRSFLGTGRSQQAARHDAAKCALELFQSMPIPLHTKKPADEKNTSPVVNSKPDGKTDQGSSKHAKVKSPISELYEKASLHKLHVDFTVTSEEGLPHLKLFTIEVTIKSPKQSDGNIVKAEGRGPNKTVAKSNAAEAALYKLKDAPLPPKVQKSKKNHNQKKQSGDKVVTSDSSSTLHPVSRLMQIMQAKKETDPVYSLVSSSPAKERGTNFVVQCCVREHTTKGEGSSKRDAKRIAAEAMLKTLGYSITNAGTMNSVPADRPGKSILKSKTTTGQHLTKPILTDQRMKFRTASKKHNVMPTLPES